MNGVPGFPQWVPGFSKYVPCFLNRVSGFVRICILLKKGAQEIFTVVSWSGQWFLLNWFLGPKFDSYGSDVSAFTPEDEDKLGAYAFTTEDKLDPRVSIMIGSITDLYPLSFTFYILQACSMLKELLYNGRPVCPKTRPLANVAFSSAKCQTNDDDI